MRVDFDRRIKLEFHGARITSDGGLLAYRELDAALGLAEIAITKLLEGRRGKNALAWRAGTEQGRLGKPPSEGISITGAFTRGFHVV